jgi:hypothetical protein
VYDKGKPEIEQQPIERVIKAAAGIRIEMENIQFSNNQ